MSSVRSFLATAPRRRSTTVLAALGAMLIAAACASDGRELREAAAPASLPIATLPPTSLDDGSEGDAVPILPPTELRSADFTDGQHLPVELTCDGANRSPDLAWPPMPAGTQEVAISFSDPDAGGFVHWIVGNLPPTATAVAGGRVPDGAVEGTNGFGEPGWAGPCPPIGDGPHRYVVTVYGLLGDSGLTGTEDPVEALGRLELASYTAKHTLTAAYQR